MRNENALAALFPGTRKQILQATFCQPDRWWTLAELAEAAGARVAELRCDLRALTAGGVLRRRRTDRRSYFRPNADCPFFAEIQAIVAKVTVAPSAHPTAATILVVEDEPATLKIARILLESWGYKVLEASNGEEAMRIFRGNNGDIRLLLTDVVMPGMRGTELARRLMKEQPGLRVIFMSGYPNEELSRGGVSYLQKPFNPAGLARLVREQLNRL